MATTIEIPKGGCSTLFFQVQKKQTPSSTPVAYDLTSTTSVLNISTTKDAPIILSKSSTSVTEIEYTSATAGEMEIHLANTDTESWYAPQKYYYTLWNSASGHTFALVTDSFKLVDTVK